MREVDTTITQASTATPTTTTTSEATTTTTAAPIVTEPTTPDEPEVVNNIPVIKARLAKLAVTAGKPFTHIVPLDTFYDTEDGTNLKLELVDKQEKALEPKSWIQFNADSRSIYGL